MWRQTRKSDELIALADEKGALFWKAFGMLIARLPVCPDRQSLGRSPNDHLRDHRIAVNGSNDVDAVCIVAFGERLCRTRPIR